MSQDEELLVGYVERALEIQDRGEVLDLGALCADHPELTQAVAETLGLQSVAARAHDGPARDPLVGRRLGRYELQRCIGRGAMGAVYEAFDRKLERVVALKVLPPDLFGRTDREERFLREARILASLSHPNIVPIHDQGREEDGLCWLVMDRLSGVPMTVLLQHMSESGTTIFSESTAWLSEYGIQARELNTLRQVVSWGMELASGLAVAHDSGVLHRDVKPSNAFVTAGGRAVLLDFGIAMRQTDGALTAAGTTLGTPWYMAPEQLAESRAAGGELGPPVDVYGLCATLYHMVTLRPPFEGEPLQVMRVLEREDPVPPLTHNPGLARDLGAILEHGLERRSRDRYASVDALRTDLRAFLDHAPVSARPLSVAGRAWRKVKRRPAVAAAGALTVVVLILVLALIPLWRSQQAERDAQRHLELVAQVPALLAIESQPEQRVAIPADEGRAALRVLDEILEIRPGDVLHRLLRASVRLDLGQFDDAHRDIVSMAALAPSEYLDGLAAAYEGLNRGKRGVLALSLEGLPDPKTATDKLCSAFHLLRLRKDIAKADALLASCESVAGRQLRLLTTLNQADTNRDWEQRRQLARMAHQDALAIEAEIGRQIARTQQVAGAALIVLKNYETAVPYLEKANELSPGRHGPLHNLGVAYRRQRRWTEAEKMLRAAHELRPWLANTTFTLAQVRWDQGDFEAARRLALSIPDEDELVGGWRKPYLLGRTDIEQAYAHLCKGRARDAVAAARASLGHFQRAIEKGAPKRTGQMVVLARSIAGRKTADSLVPFLLEMKKSKSLSSSRQIQNLAALLPDQGMDAELTGVLRWYLLELASDLAPEDPLPREQLRKLTGK